MRVLVIGAGGREQAIAWACKRHGHHVDIRADLPEPLVADLVIVGPEAALVAGVADRCAEAHVPCFGPTAALARLESSKGFTRTLAATLDLPSPEFHMASSAEAAVAWWRQFGRPVVVKLDGLAAGKGVIVPDGEAATIAAIEELVAQGPIVLEERLTGPECSLMAVCDGSVARPLPIAQDHKRIGEGDSGANTGGMGAYAPAPLMTTELRDEVRRTVLQPAIDGLAAEGMPYVGVLYAGMMLTGSRYGADAYSTSGMRTLEFNCRFGDPETQVILPLLESDLIDVIEACLDGRLAEMDVRWRDGAAATVVAASEGYPGSYPKGREINGVAEAAALPGVAVFHAGTRLAEDGRLLTDGGRVLAVTGVGDNLPAALARAYSGIEHIHFQGMHYRRDIGAKADVG